MTRKQGLKRHPIYLHPVRVALDTFPVLFIWMPFIARQKIFRVDGKLYCLWIEFLTLFQNYQISHYSSFIYTQQKNLNNSWYFAVASCFVSQYQLNILFIVIIRTVIWFLEMIQIFKSTYTFKYTKNYKRGIFFTIIFSFENHMATNLYFDIV